jgi:Glycosyl hydrolase family 53
MEREPDVPDCLLSLGKVSLTPARIKRAVGYIFTTSAAPGRPIDPVETAYPFTNDGGDASPNLLGADTLIRGYPATPDGQLKYLTDITQTVVDNGGIGLVY